MPGNTIAPNFDPTKSGTVVISSAGQLGRGGNVSIDAMDDNDDVVGGMLLNVPEDSVQEFQVATNRFSAELGRSGSAVVNVVTKSGSNSLHGSASIYERDKSLQAHSRDLYPRRPGETPSFQPPAIFRHPGRPAGQRQSVVVRRIRVSRRTWRRADRKPPLRRQRRRIDFHRVRFGASNGPNGNAAWRLEGFEPG